MRLVTMTFEPEPMAPLAGVGTQNRGPLVGARLARVADDVPGTALVPVRPVAEFDVRAEPEDLPQVGDLFLGFRLVGELGAGSFGKVYLAQQANLADRLVALKVTCDAGGEAQRLARLQHTNIVPIHSVHHAPPFQAVCMPYLGPVTLADVLRAVRDGPSLPSSGGGLFSTAHHRSAAGGSSRLSASSSSFLPGQAGAAAAERPETSHPAANDAGRPSPIRDRLARMGYVDAILWIGSRIADALAHAHERGILHRDLKPANVLLSDDGQPMLLDFNLSVDTHRAGPVRAGGTLRYMAPEQLEEVLGRANDSPRVDARSDLFALGVILFELLTSRTPYPQRPGKPDVADLAAARLRGPPRLRGMHPGITPAVESIVHTLLHPDPDRRYQSARDLHEDLERQLAGLPLLHAPERSWRERAGKWLRRHPRAGPAAALSVAAAAVLALGLTAAEHAHARQRAAALRAAEGFAGRLSALRVDLGGPAEALRRRAVADRARSALAEFGLPDDPAWRGRPAFRALDPDHRAALAADLGETLLLLAGLEWRGATPDGPGLAAGRALRLNRLAEECFGPGNAPPLLWHQRAELAEALGDGPAAAEARGRADAGPRSARDLYLEGARELVAGRFKEATGPLRQAVELDPGHFAAQLGLAACYQGLNHHARALERYDVARALRPDLPHPYFNRGLIRLRLKQFDEARAEFDRAVERDPSWAEAYKHRATALHHIGEPQAAVEDLTRALELSGPTVHLLLTRARLLGAALRQSKQAAADRAVASGLEPLTDTDFFARGVDRALAHDPEGALKDFERAAALNPNSLEAFNNQAHVLAERLRRPDEAVEVLGRALRLQRDSVPLLGSRAVLYARLGRRDEALADAELCQALGADAGGLYQLAGVYALTSRQHPDDRRRAIALLRAALLRGFDNFNLIARDGDLDPIRQLPEFRQALAEGKKLSRLPAVAADHDDAGRPE